MDSGGNIDDVLPDGTSVMMLAIVNGQYEIAKFLLERGADPNAEGSGRTALHALVQTHNWDGNDFAPVEEHGDYFEMMRALLARGANPNARLTKPNLEFAHHRGSGQYNAIIRSIGATPFWWAARAADTTAMRMLLAAGADPLLGTVDNTTPLMIAAGVGYLDAQTPGSERDALETVKMLLDLGAPVNDANSGDPTALASSVRYPVECGWTPLHGAASRGADSIVQLLVERGANLDAKDTMGRTPLQLTQGHQVMISVYIRPSTERLLRKLASANPVPIGDSLQSPTPR